MTVLVRSPLLDAEGFAHGFSLRTGGVSAPPFDTLNLGRALGDDAAAVAENLARFAREVPCGVDALYEVSQVHGRRVRFVRRDEHPQDVRLEEGDALATDEAGVAVGIRVADCVPILLADPRSGAVAAIHSGWRGTVLGVVGAAVRVLVERASVRPGDLLAAIGPHIRMGAFEVGDEVAVQLEALVPGERVVDRSYPRPHVDLAAIVRTQLADAGVGRSRVEDVEGCTFADEARFFSFRRDGRSSGRHLAAIVARRHG